MSDELESRNACPSERGVFSTTHWSVVLAAGQRESVRSAEALEFLCRQYWPPVYAFIRRRGHQPDDAQDLTQEFFARLIEKDFLASYDTARARLRTFLRTCVDALVANEERASSRLKRGGRAVLLPLDFELAEGELARSAQPSPADPEVFFEKEWVRSLFGLALEQLQSECQARGREKHFRLFETYDLEDSGERRISYEDLAREYRIEATDVTNHLALARREFRRITLDLLREMTAGEEEFRREARSLRMFPAISMGGRFRPILKASSREPAGYTRSTAPQCCWF